MDKEKTAEKHGEDEAGCETEKKALNETPVESEMERIENFRKRIAEEKAKTGKAYLSFFFQELSFSMHSREYS